MMICSLTDLGILTIPSDVTRLIAGNIVSIAFFNFSGISVMKEMNATTRMVLDSCRTVVIWVVSLSVGWQAFTWQSFLLQSFGFVLLIGGTFVYNNVIFAPFLVRHNCLRPEDEDRLSESEPGISVFCLMKVPC